MMILIGLILIMLVGILALAVLGAYCVWAMLTLKYLIEAFECFRDKDEVEKYKVFITEELRDMEVEEIAMGAFVMLASHVVFFLVGLLVIVPFIA